jgi:hypothetical protein
VDSGASFPSEIASLAAATLEPGAPEAPTEDSADEDDV